MKKYILLFVFLFSITIGSAQPPTGPVTTEPCPCCEEMVDQNGAPIQPEYDQCKSDCMADLKPCTPIDSGILILVILGASLGIYQVYKNKKRQFQN